MYILVLIFGVISSSVALDNGLALTPPMGWLTWQRYRCTTDCDTYPDDCISETLIEKTADHMVNEGYLDAGYNYIGIDDCWLEKNRSADGKLVADRKRFSKGMKALADYVHSKGLLFGIYEDYGNKTCAGYPGVMHHEQSDVDTLVAWDVDYIKLDGCFADDDDFDRGYPDFGNRLNSSGRPVLYSCSWPAYLEGRVEPDYAKIAKYCNLWRNWDDIDDSWVSLKTVMNWFGDNQERIQPYAGPGHWNDPDMLLVGNYGLSVDQARVQMAVWAILAAPLLISANLATMRPEFKEILLNRDIIAVNQDSLGIQGLRVQNEKHKKVWTRELSGNSYAVAIVFIDESSGRPNLFKLSFEDMKIPEQTYTVQDLYNEEEERILKPKEKLITRVNPSGVKFYKLIPKTCDDLEKKKGYIHLNVNNDLDKTVVVV